MRDVHQRLGKSILRDSMWSIVGVVLMNAVAQLFIYPLWDRRMGCEKYGTVLYLLSLMNIVAISLGSALNYGRMCNRGENVKNSSYIIILSGGSVLFGVAGIMCRRLLALDFSTVVLFALLAGCTMWRYYADVEFRLSLNYRRYFFFCLIIGVGYGMGALVYLGTDQWVLTLLFGEVLGVMFVMWKGNALRFDGFPAKEEFTEVFRGGALLACSNIISNLIFNGDRLILNYFSGGTAVTSYYLASLVGKMATLVTTPFNSVLIGYLKRYDGGLEKGAVILIAGCSIAISLVGVLGCYSVSILLLPLLYPAEYERVKPFLWLGNLAQIVFFVGNIFNTILLRFGRSHDQLSVNMLYGVAFVLFCVPATYVWGVRGFCFAYIVTTVTRLAFSILLLFLRSGKSRQVEVVAF